MLIGVPSLNSMDLAFSSHSIHKMLENDIQTD